MISDQVSHGCAVKNPDGGERLQMHDRGPLQPASTASSASRPTFSKRSGRMRISPLATACTARRVVLDGQGV